MAKSLKAVPTCSKILEKKLNLFSNPTLTRVAKILQKCTWWYTAYYKLS